MLRRPPSSTLSSSSAASDVYKRQLLHYISEVFQENTLLSDTIYNNIKAGREDATEQEVIAAAKAAHCHEFIERLPNGYQTHLAEGGNTLSGGEKQRIAIARAILKDAPILLLDESTASLDLSLIHISEPTRRTPISYAVFCLKKKKQSKKSA